MNNELSSFEGREVQAAVARFSGRVTSRVGEYAQDEFALVVARVRVNKISYQDFQARTGTNQAKLFSRIHDMTVVRGVVLDEKGGAALLDQAIAMADDRFGIESLFSEVLGDVKADELRPTGHVFNDADGNETHCECEIGEDHFDFTSPEDLSALPADEPEPSFIEDLPNEDEAQ